ncbi:MAG: hypothetical protein K6G19_00385 [Lachnospiraceae bacterium]|nr:hypothetical protein [Lachnospiraceae bacterium]
MKKRMIALLTLAMSITMVSSAWAGVFDNYVDYQNPDGTYSYYFDEGVLITLDENWYQNTIVKIEEQGVTFYQKASHDAWEKEGYEEGGRLFTIGASVNTSFSELPSFEYIGFDEDTCMNYYAELPTDYPAYMGDESIRAEYDALWAEARDVIAGIQIGTDQPKAAEHRITLTGDLNVFRGCPESAKAGEKVTVYVVGVADGEVVLDVNGENIGSWEDYNIYSFTMPDEDVEINGWIRTAGYPGAETSDRLYSF